MGRPAFLLLENGIFLEGKGFGACGEALGEAVFTTAMTGYLETLTDPSYCGQIVLQTFPLIGNYGIIPDDFEREEPRLSGYIVREWCQEPSNFRSKGNLDAFLQERGIPGIYGLDTREITKLIRTNGTMNACILPFLPEDLSEWTVRLRAYRMENVVEQATCRKIEVFGSDEAKRHIVLWDFGAKENIRRELLARDCQVIQVPAGTGAEKIAALHPDGVMLSNGPGDPADNPEIIREVFLLCQKNIPLFGICLGHQLLALAHRGKTVKLKFGHRGANQPVRDTKTGNVYITSQNHGYAVLSDRLPNGAEVRYVNANDGTCEGIDYRNIDAFSVQFHPEGHGGPLDTRFLFDRFMSRIDQKGRV